MSEPITRRETIRRGLAATSLLALSPDWALPALAQGETLVPFTDLPANFNPTPSPDRRTLDIRKIDGPFTPKDQFFTTQHFGPSRGRPGNVRAAGLRAGGSAEVVLAR